jgi:PKD repeat protein
MKTNIKFILVFVVILSASCKKDDPAAPVAEFNYAGANSAPTTVYFTNNSKNASYYLWDFGDGYTSVEVSPSHLYQNSGVYTVSLKATGDGGTNTAVKTINIQPPPTICKIKSVRLINMPFLNSAGASWDSFDGPDVFFMITTNSGNIIIDGTSSRYSNITPNSLPLGWTLNNPVSISPINNQRNILIYDYDFPDADDYIGGIGFNPQQSLNGYPTTATFTYQGVTIELGLEWN